MGRLLKAFNMDFNWHHLASWANITEQWPYRTSWLCLTVEQNADRLEDGVPLKQIYDKVKPSIPTGKDTEPLLESDRDEKKLDVFLSLHKKTLTVADLKIFLPFTINLDPFLKKVIKEEVASSLAAEKAGQSSVGLSGASLPGLPRPLLPRELQGRVLSSFSLEQVCLLLSTIQGINNSMVATYCASIVGNNVTGLVLLHCSTAELRSVINMNFGDWELFKLVLTAMRGDEQSGEWGEAREGSQEISRSETKYRQHKQSVIEKQVAMEEATVSGLLSTLNEVRRKLSIGYFSGNTEQSSRFYIVQDAKEDILQEEVSAAQETVGKLLPDQKERESDFLYYSHPSPQVHRDWSRASPSESQQELENGGRSSPARSQPRHLLTDRAHTLLNFSQATEEGWEPNTAPGSPSQQRSAHSDPGYPRISAAARSVRRTKRREAGERVEQGSPENLSRAGSSSRLAARVRRRIRKALDSNEPGQLPVVQRARPNLEEYQQFSQAASRRSSLASSPALSDESLSSPEQQTVTRRPGAQNNDAARPALQAIFPSSEEAGGQAVLTAFLPDGSRMFHIGSNNSDQ